MFDGPRPLNVAEFHVRCVVFVVSAACVCAALNLPFPCPSMLIAGLFPPSTERVLCV